MPKIFEFPKLSAPHPPFIITVNPIQSFNKSTGKDGPGQVKYTSPQAPPQPQPQPSTSSGQKGRVDGKQKVRNTSSPLAPPPPPKPQPSTISGQKEGKDRKEKVKNKRGVVKANIRPGDNSKKAKVEKRSYWKNEKKDQNLYECEKCHKSFGAAIHLSNHRRNCQVTFTCQICNKSFQLSSKRLHVDRCKKKHNIE